MRTLSAISRKRNEACQLPPKKGGKACRGTVKYVYDTRLCLRHRKILEAITVTAAKAERRAAEQER